MMSEEKIILITSCMGSDNNIDFEKINISHEENELIENGELELEDLINEKCAIHNFDTWLEFPATKQNLSKLKELVELVEKKLDIDKNDEFFCLIHELLHKLPNYETHILSDKEHKKLVSTDKLLIIDSNIKQLAYDFSKNWDVTKK